MKTPIILLHIQLLIKALISNALSKSTPVVDVIQPVYVSTIELTILTPHNRPEQVAPHIASPFQPKPQK